MEILKEHIAANSEQTLRFGLQEGSHVSSTREEIVPEVSEQTPVIRVRERVPKCLDLMVPVITVYVMFLSQLSDQIS